MKITEWQTHYKDCFPVGEGWRKLVDRLVDEITAIDPTTDVMQVKEKFGGLRFYISGGNEEIDHMINWAEKESYKICEQCGTRKGVTTKGGWLLTLCGKCRKSN